MGITFTSGATTILDGDYTFEDIYQASQDAGNTYCKKLGTAYLIKNDVIVGDHSTPTTLSGQNISVTIEGDLFQIKRQATVNFGTIDSNTGATKDGCFVSCPNIKNGYGFGCTEKDGALTKSGNLFAYATFLDIFGFWGFFGGEDQHCEIIDCLVNGFGRIEGQNSIIKNVTTQKSHGRYGVLSSKGIIKTYENVSSKEVLEYKGHTCSVYFNPKYAPNLRIIGGTYDGYSEGLLYSEPNKTGVAVSGYCTFVDTEIKNGFGGYFSDDTTKYFVKYTFNPRFKNVGNSAIANCNVTITDNFGTVVFDGQGDSEGYLNIELTKYEADTNAETEFSYYDITASFTDSAGAEVTVTRRYDAGITYKDFPFYVVNEGSGGSGGGDCVIADIQDMMDALQSNINSTINTSKSQIESKMDNVKAEIITEIDENEDKIDSLAANNNTLLVALGEEINENQTIIESKTGNTRMFL